MASKRHFGFGMLAYLIMPLMLYRLIFCQAIPDALNQPLRFSRRPPVYHHCRLFNRLRAGVNSLSRLTAEHRHFDDEHHLLGLLSPVKAAL